MSGDIKMDKKKVYLFELDSVRKTDEEIIYGQRCLYNEIVANGNVVVMTFNQFVDSRAFFNLLDDKDYRENIIELFNEGILKISQYKDTRTVVQYLLDSVQSEKEFIYSALPIKFTQKRLLALLKRSLINSDLSELYEYFDEYEEDKLIHEGSLKNEISLLFEEFDKEGNSLDVSIIDLNKSKEDASLELQKICKKLYHLLETVLTISPKHQIYTYAKIADEYANFKLGFYLNAILNKENLKLTINNKKISDEEINSIKKILKNTKTGGNIDDRSVLLRRLKDKYDKKKRKEEVKTLYQYSEIIINLCYNYACEASIRNISKHYNLGKKEDKKMELDSFFEDFSRRFDSAWKIGSKENDSKYLTNETNEFKDLDVKKYKKWYRFFTKDKLPNFKTGLRLLEYQNFDFDKNSEEKEMQDIKRYEYRLISQKRKVLVYSLARIFVLILQSLLWLIVTYCLNVKLDPLTSGFKESISDYLPTLPFIITIISTLFAEIISRAIAIILPFMQPFSEALANLIKYTMDLTRIIVKLIYSIFKENNFINNKKYSYKERFNKKRNLNIAYSREMNDYLKFKSNNKKIYFKNKDKNPKFADCSDEVCKKSIIDYENTHNCKFGIIYKSRYNELIVDPMIDKDGNVFGYDRLISPYKKSGVVVVAKHNGKFIILEQFRHAFRKVMYNFPRGFAERALSYEKNAKKELIEEIGWDEDEAKHTKLITLGYIAPDSGLTDKLVHIYYVEIKNYGKRNTDEKEAINDVVELSEKEMNELIGSGKITDGFTLGAYLLYKQAKASRKI